MNKEKKYVTTGTAVGAVGGGAYSFLKMPNYYRGVVTKNEKQKFLKSLKRGDVLLSGYDSAGVTGRTFQTLQDRNSPYYHTVVYTGKGKFLDLGLGDEPTKKPAYQDLKSAMDYEDFRAYRPKLTSKERNKFVSKVEKNIQRTKYSPMGAIKAQMLDALKIKNLKCKGDFCSNVITKQLPQKMFTDRHLSTVLPKHIAQSPKFELIAEIDKFRNHLPFSNSSLKKYVLLPAATLGAVGYGLSKLKNDRKHKK
jgi:hypothetical protein